MKNAILALLALVAFSACSKSSDDEPTKPAATIKKLYPAIVVEKDENGDTTKETTYEYDNENRLAKSTITDNEDGTTEINTYTYNSTVIALITHTLKLDDGSKVGNGKTVFNYEGNLLTTLADYKQNAATPYNRDTLYYQAGNTRPSVIKINNGEEKLELTYDAAGNKTTLQDTDATSVYTVTFSYDMTHTYFNWCIPNPVATEAIYYNCPTEIKIAGKEGGVDISNEIQTYTYEFNADGYPTKVTVKSVFDDLTPDNEDVTETTVYEITYKSFNIVKW